MKKIICLLVTLMILTGCSAGASTNSQNNDEPDELVTINDAIQKMLDLKDISFQLIILSLGSLDSGEDPFNEYKSIGEKFEFRVKNWKSLSPEIYGTYHDKWFEHRYGDTIFMDKDRVYLVSGYSMRSRRDIKAWFDNTPENLVRYNSEVFGKIIDYVTMYLKKLPKDAAIGEVRLENGETEYHFDLIPEQFVEVYPEYVEAVKHKHVELFGFYTDYETVRYGLECHGTIKVNSEGYVTEYTIVFKNEEHNPDADEPVQINPYTISLKFEEPGKDVLIEKPDFSEYQNYEDYLNNLPEPDPGDIVLYKPIIYLYPEKVTEVTVKMGHSENLICSYPKYVNGWNVTAYPDGKLIYNETGRELYSLYWEGNNKTAYMTDEGFCVKGEDTASFLEEKLALLGLSEREAEEFIIFWLHILENNEYNYIRFESMEDMNSYMPLNITPAPDTIIRVNMIFKALENPVELREQKIVTPERNGFTVVEWGGTPLD